MNLTASQPTPPRWIELSQAADERGVLTSIETGVDVPFTVQRVFFISDASGDRGNHAHRDTNQLLVAVSGVFTVDVSTGGASTSYAMDSRARGLLLPPMTWVRLHSFSSDAVCLVLADRSYAESAYIRDWEEFTREAAAKGRETTTSPR